MTNIKDLEPFNVVDIYIASVKKEGRGIVLRKYRSGGVYGVRVVGVTEDKEPFDVGISKSSAIRRTIVPAPLGGVKLERTEIKTGRHEGST